MLAIIASIYRSLGFLTRLSIHKKWYKQPVLPNEDAACFPIAGFFIGIWGVIFFLIALFLNLGSIIAAIISYIAIIFLTGALHEDGLSDTFDGFFAQKDLPTTLDIMKDSRIGVFGALSLILSITFKIALLHHLTLYHSTTYAMTALIGAEMISRAAMIWLWYYLPFARTNGVAATMGAPHFTAIRHGILYATLLLIILMLLSFNFIGFFLGVGFTIITAFFFMRLCRQKIGGITGDCLGALQQLSVLAFLIGVAIL